MLTLSRFALSVCLSGLTVALSSDCAVSGAYPLPALRQVVMQRELIVRGTVKSVTTSTVETNGVEHPATVVRVEIQEVLKGSWQDREVDAVLEGNEQSPSTAHVYDYQIGQDVIFLLDVVPQADGNLCRLWAANQSFVYRDGQWMSRRGRSVSVEEILAEISRLRLDQASVDADAAFVGTVQGVERKQFDCGTDMSCVADYMSVRVDDAWKGVSKGDIVLVRALRHGSNLDWFAPMPAVRAGNSYVMLLKRDDVGYYPFVGFNGFLRIHGDELIMNEDVVYPISKAKAVSAISAAVSR